MSGPDLLVNLGNNARDAHESLAAAGGNGSFRLVSAGDLWAAPVRRARAAGRPETIAMAGGPPDREVGFGVAALLALSRRPRRVMLLDTRNGQTHVRTPGRFLADIGPAALGQVVAGAGALALQRAVAHRLLRRSPSARPAPELTRALYLRHAGGTPGAVGGSVTHAHEVIRALDEAGVDVSCWTTDRRIALTAAREDDPPCRWGVVNVPRPFKALPATQGIGGDLALARAGLPKARHSDLIYQRHSRFVMAGPLLAALSGRPLFLEYNSPSDFGTSDPAAFAEQRRLCEEVALAWATRIVVVSDVAKRQLVDRGISADRVLVNPNGVHADRFARGGGTEVRERLGIDSNDFVVAFLGSFQAFHGTPVLAHAFAALVRSNSRAHLVLMGEGGERAEVERMVAEAGIGARVHFTGAIHPAEVPSHLDAADVLASPHVPLDDGTEFFGSPTKLFEYMAAGKAIVASSQGQIADVLEDGETGLLTVPGDPVDLASALDRLRVDEDLRGRLGTRARAQAVAEHGWDRNARRVAEAYGELAGSAC
jgi:glycosyltransferase involved in cell wall biosynthesis